MTEKEVLEALKIAYEKAGTQGKLAKSAGLSQSTISDYINGRCAIGNMTISVFLRLFPHLIIDFFGETKNQGEANDVLNNQIQDMFEKLTIGQKARCIAIIGASFPENILNEVKS